MDCQSWVRMSQVWRRKMGILIRWVVNEIACNIVAHNLEYSLFSGVQFSQHDAPNNASDRTVTRCAAHCRSRRALAPPQTIRNSRILRDFTSTTTPRRALEY